MILCLGNALSDTWIADAIRQGARRPCDVHARCGCRARCGRCTASILGVLRSTASPPRPTAKQDR